MTQEEINRLKELLPIEYKFYDNGMYEAYIGGPRPETLKPIIDFIDELIRNKDATI